MDRRFPILVLVVIALATGGRLWLASTLPLVDDEAYYWAWSRRLAWGYPDHPPAIAGLIRSTIWWLGDTPLGARLGAVALSAGSAWLLFDLGRMMYAPAAGAVAAVGFQVIPSLSVGSIFAFPDAPQIFFWLLTLWALWRARTWDRTSDWYLMGLAAGLTAMSKLTAAFLAISVVGYLCATRSERRWLRRPEPYLAAVIAFAVFLPFVFWNANHWWITFHRAREPVPWVVTHVPALNALAFAGAQLAYYGPVTFPLLVAALASMLTRLRRTDPRSAFLLWGAFPIIATTWAASFDGIPKPHWHAPGLLLGLIAAGALWWSQGMRSAWRVIAAIGVLLSLAVIGVVVAIPFRMDSPSAGQIWGWDQVARKLEPLIQQTPSSPGRFILTQRYQVAAPVELHLRGRHVVATTSGGNAYDDWVPHQRLIDHNAVYINDLESGAGVAIERIFRRVETLPPIEVRLDGRVVRRFSVYRGFGFRGLPRPAVFPDFPEDGRLRHRR
ncbi:MAG: ArnT family glycosyltransferase [bacterium]